MQIIIDEKVFEDVESAAEYVVDNYATEDVFDEEMETCYDDVEILGRSFTLITVLKRVDKVWYRELYLDWLYRVCDDVMYELENGDDMIFGVEVEYVFDEDESE